MHLPLIVKRVLFLWSLASLMVLWSCTKEPEFQDPADVVVVRDLEVQTSTSYQVISGFGAANQMWGTQFPSNDEIDLAFSSASGSLGLSIFRVRVASNPDEWPLIVDVAKRAQSHGAIILASPWSPPPSLKSNNSDVGGRLLEENYQSFVTHLNEFVSYMSDNGVNIHAVSIQNEPDIEVGYESCDWTSLEMRDFIKSYGAEVSGAKLAAPESFNFNQSFSDPLLNDTESEANVDIIAGHIYGGGQASYPLAESKGKEIWMTEYLLNLNTGNSGATPWADRSDEDKWTESMEMLGTIHTAMSNNWNAYIWWYLKRYYSFLGDGTEGTTEGEILKRGYAFSHYAKFIRPGYHRVNIDFNASLGLEITAYSGDDQTILVVINDGATKVANINVVVDDVVPESAQVYVTSLEKNREESTLEKTDGNLLFAAAPQSVTTIVINH